MNLKKFNEKRGITLIALVVTIIVLLILAGISISMLTGQNGVLNRAKGAKEEYSNSTEKEQVQLSYNSAITRKLGESITAEELQNELNEVVGKNEDGTSKTETTDIGEGVFNVKFVKTNHNYRVDNGNVTLLIEDKSVVEPNNIADWEYDPNDDGTLTITGYKGSDTEVVIPNYINGVKVKKIEAEASSVDSIWGESIRDDDSKFYYGCVPRKGQKTIKTITISYGIEEIGDFAFAGTIKLESVRIPSSVTSIGNYAFDSCSSLENVTMPSSVTNIGEYAFADCRSLKNITIPSGVTSIAQRAFANCRSLTSITIPSSVTSIEDVAFYCCESLTNITIPSSVTSIGEDAFGGCSSLTNVTIPSSVTTIKGSAFSFCTNLTNIEIPAGVTSIEEGTFNGCSSLANITIPTGITTIGLSAFDGCSSLTNVTIPAGVTSIAQQAFANCSSLTNITIPSSVTNIGNFAFINCSNLTNITIPSTVTSMGLKVFDGIPSITVTVPYKSGENPPSGWDSRWNNPGYNCEIKIKYQE